MIHLFKQKLVLLFILVLVPLLSYAAQTGYSAIIEGSNHVIRDVRQLPPIKDITVSGPVTLIVKQSPNQQLIVEAEHNIMALLDINIKPGTIKLALKGQSIKPKKPVTFTLYINDFQTLNAFGQAQIDGKSGFKTNTLSISLNDTVQATMNLNSQKLKIQLNRHGRLNAIGRALHQDILLKESTFFEGHHLHGIEGNLRITGSGTGVVNIKQQLKVEVMGSGTAIYQGKPTINKQIATSGQLIAASDQNP